VTTSPRRQLWLLIALVIAGTVIVTLRLLPSASDNTDGAVQATGGVPETRQGNPVGDIRLESLESRDEASATPTRDVFQFESRRAEAPEAVESRPSPPVDSTPPAPVGPPPPPPIPLRYIGYLDQPGQIPRVAVLSDGRGNVFNGKEGDIIEGRYRVLRIGTDSADLIYVDGRGQQTIRLSGQ
jgi:hypothetical protein